MPQIIEVPGMGHVSFPDGMTDADISAAIQRNMAPKGLDFFDPLSPTSVKRAADSRTPPDVPSMGGSFAREAARSVGPGLVGFKAGAASGAALGAAGLNPVTVAAGAVIGGVGGFMLSRKVSDEVADAIAPNSFMGTKSAEADMAANKWSTMLGGAIGGGGAPGPLRGVTAIPKLFTTGGRQALTAGLREGAPLAARQASSDIMEPLIGAGVGAGLGATHGADAAGVAEQAGLGLIFNRGWMHRVGRTPQSLPTDSQNGVQGEPATGSLAGDGVIPHETNAAVGTRDNPSRAFAIMEANALANRLKTGQPLETPTPPAAPEPLTFDGGPVVRGPVVRGPVVEGPVARGPIVEGPRGPVVGEAMPREAWQGPLAPRVEGPRVRGPQIDSPTMDGPLAPLVEGPRVGMDAPVIARPLAVRAPEVLAPDGPTMLGPSVDRPFVDGPLGQEVLGPPKIKVGQDIFTDTDSPLASTRLDPASRQLGGKPFNSTDIAARLRAPAEAPAAPEPPAPAIAAEVSRQIGNQQFNSTDVAARMRAQQEVQPTISPEAKSPSLPDVPAVPATPEVAPLKGTVALATGRLNAAKNQLAKLEASGKATPDQLAKRRASIATLEAQIKAAQPDAPSRERELQKRVSEVHDSGEFDLVGRIREMGGFAPQGKEAGLIEVNARRGRKLSEKNRKVAAGFGETRDDAARASDFPDTPGGNLAAATLRSLHNKSSTALTADKMAEALGMTVRDFHAKLNAELESIHRNNGPKANEYDVLMARQERQAVDLEKAVENSHPDDISTPRAEGLEKGDTFVIDGEPIKVIESDGETVTLRDGERFGEQTVSNDTPIPIEKLTSPARVRTAEEIAAQKEMDAVADSEARARADSEIPADDAIAAKNAEDSSAESAKVADDFALKAHESDAEILAEKKAAEQKAELAKRQSARLKGDAGDLTPDIFGEGDTPLFNEHRDTPQQKSILDGLKAHRDDVDNWLKSEKKSGRLNAMPIDILGATAYRTALDLVVKGVEAGQRIGTVVRKIITDIKKSRALTRDEEISIKSALIKQGTDYMRFQGERDAKFFHEMPKVAEELAAQGKPTNLPDLINGLAARFPEHAAYIRANGAKIHADMVFARDTRLSRKTESLREWGEWGDSALEGAKKLIYGTIKGSPATRAKQLATSFHATYMTGIGNKMRHLAQGNITGQESTAFGKFTEDLVGLAKGKDGVHRVATDLQMHNDVTTFANHLDRIKTELLPTLKAMPRNERQAFMERVGDHITDSSRDGELASQPALKKAVDSYIKIREDLLKHMKDAGVEVGDVGPRSMRRVLDRPTVLANPKEFVKQAANAYRAKWRAETAKLNAEAATLDPVKDKARLASIRSELAEIAKRDAIDSAQKYLTNIEADETGITSNGNDLFEVNRGNPSSIKSREFGPEADQLLGKFYLRDPDAILRREIGDAVRAAGVARTFSAPKLDAAGKPLGTGEIDPLGKWKKLRQDMIDEGNADMVPLAATLLKEHFNLGGQDNPTMRKALEIAHTHAQLTFLARSALSSMGEPALAGIRSGRISDVAAGYVKTVKGMVRELRGASPEDARLMSNAIGASSDGFNSILAANRFLDSYAVAGKAGELVAMFHAKTWLTALTNSTHAAAIDIGHSFIRTQLGLRASGGKFKTTAGKALNELGIQTKDIPAMQKFADDLAVATDKVALLSANTPEAKMYRDALHLFKNSGASLNVVRGTRPQHANSPIGGMFYALKSFLFAFQDQVLSRHARLMKTAATGETMVDGAMEKLSTAERAKMIGETLQAITVIAASQYAIQKVRESLFNDPARKIEENKTAAEQARFRAYSVATRSSFFGGYDIVFNAFTGARHGGDPATALLGPSLGLASSIAGQVAGTGGKKDSANTNTHERKLARSVWDAAAKPVVNAAFATMPGYKVAAPLVQAFNHPGTREALVKRVAGPPMQHGPMKKKKGF